MGFSYNNILLICEGKRKFRPQAPVTVFLFIVVPATVWQLGTITARDGPKIFLGGLGVGCGLGERRGC